MNKNLSAEKTNGEIESIIKIQEVSRMNMVPCISDCFYQCDGFCRLEKYMPITNSSFKGCPYYKPKSSGIYLPPSEKFNYSKPRWLV